MIFLKVIFFRSAVSVPLGIPVRNANSAGPAHTYRIRNFGDGGPSHMCFNKPEVILVIAKDGPPVI